MTKLGFITKLFGYLFVGLMVMAFIYSIALMFDLKFNDNIIELTVGILMFSGMVGGLRGYITDMIKNKTGR